MAEIRDRIVDFKRVRSADLIPNPDNWRRHPPEQVNALRGLLDQIGFADAALGVERDGGVMLIDGHLRREEVDDDFPVPVLILDLDESETNLLLATLDPLAAMAATDPAALASILADLEPGNDEVAALLDGLMDDVTSRGARDGLVPDEFPSIDPDALDLEHVCPRCGFEWTDS